MSGYGVSLRASLVGERSPGQQSFDHLSGYVGDSRLFRLCICSSLLRLGNRCHNFPSELFQLFLDGRRVLAERTHQHQGILVELLHRMLTQASDSSQCVVIARDLRSHFGGRTRELDEESCGAVQEVGVVACGHQGEQPLIYVSVLNGDGRLLV